MKPSHLYRGLTYEVTWYIFILWIKEMPQAKNSLYMQSLSLREDEMDNYFRS